METKTRFTGRNKSKSELFEYYIAITTARTFPLEPNDQQLIDEIVALVAMELTRCMWRNGLTVLCLCVFVYAHTSLNSSEKSRLNGYELWTEILLARTLSTWRAEQIENMKINNKKRRRCMAGMAYTRPWELIKINWISLNMFVRFMSSTLERWII